MKVVFQTDEIRTLAETVNNELPIKINIGEYQPEIKAQVVSLPKNCLYQITIEVVNE